MPRAHRHNMSFLEAKWNVGKTLQWKHHIGWWCSVCIRAYATEIVCGQVLWKELQPGTFPRECWNGHISDKQNDRWKKTRCSHSPMLARLTHGAAEGRHCACAERSPCLSPDNVVTTVRSSRYWKWRNCRPSAPRTAPSPDNRLPAGQRLLKTPWRLHRGLNWPHPIQENQRSLLLWLYQQSSYSIQRRQFTSKNNGSQSSIATLDPSHRANKSRAQCQ